MLFNCGVGSCPNAGAVQMISAQAAAKPGARRSVRISDLTKSVLRTASGEAVEPAGKNSHRRAPRPRRSPPVRSTHQFLDRRAAVEDLERPLRLVEELALLIDPQHAVHRRQHVLGSERPFLGVLAL